LPLGQLLVQRRLITGDQLEEALRIQQRTGGRLGRILVGLGAVNRLALAEALAEQLRLPHVNLRSEMPAVETVRLLEAEAARRLQCVPVRWVGSQLMVALADPGDPGTRDELTRLLHAPLISVTSGWMWMVLDRVYRSTYIEESVAGLLYRNPQESAYETFTDAQIIGGVVLLVLVLLGLALAPRQMLIFANGAAAVFYMGISLYRLWLAYRGASDNLTIMVSDAEVAGLAEADLPVYSVLIALYREKEVLPQLIRALDALDYPKSKLDVRLLLEESDRETLDAARALHPPGYITLVIVPDAAPRTKPKALNYGLVGARGQFTVIFDAEDLPDPDQLKRAVAAFRRAPPNVVCLQAKLNYYNRNQNLLTRWFTTEYSSWFDLILPGLDNTRAPIPLGGTSNHFYSEILRDVGWDPFQCDGRCRSGRASLSPGLSHGHRRFDDL
jgi:hypothetical protein